MVTNLSGGAFPSRAGDSVGNASPEAPSTTSFTTYASPGCMPHESAPAQPIETRVFERSLPHGNRAGTLGGRLAHPGTNGNARSTLKIALPRIFPMREVQWLPSLHQRLQLAGHGRDNPNPSHAAGAYPFARNQSMADRNAA